MKHDTVTTLINTMARLRDKKQGCPWDIEQDFSSIVPHTIEEAYEVAEAIHQNDMDGLKHELGDLLLQVVFHAQMAKEEGLFDFYEVVEAINDKLIRRHPHIFSDATITTSTQQTESWEKIKAAERQNKAKASGNRHSILDDIPHALPSLLRAYKIQKRVKKVGFDWDAIEDIFMKIDEEVSELKEAVHQFNDPNAIEEELGDLFFSLVNVATHLKTNPETALRNCNQKFINRFQFIEKSLAKNNKTIEKTTIEQLNILWKQAKEKA